MKKDNKRKKNVEGFLTLCRFFKKIGGIEIVIEKLNICPQSLNYWSVGGIPGKNWQQLKQLGLNYQEIEDFNASLNNNS